MELVRVQTATSRELASRIKELYTASFPKEERLPWWLLRLNACREGIDLDAWLDGDTPVGMTASVTVGRMHFLLFFAIMPQLQGKGYGSAILEVLRRECDTVVLNVELLDPTASNYAQRLRRFAFYKRNGFFDTGWHVWEVGGKFRVLSTEKTLDPAAYRKLFKKLTFGIWNVKLKEEGRS